MSFDDLPIRPALRGLVQGAMVAVLAGLGAFAMAGLVWSDTTGWWTAVGLFLTPLLVALATLAWRGAKHFEPRWSTSRRWWFVAASGLVAIAVSASVIAAAWVFASLHA